MKSKLGAIDPALDLMAEFSKYAKGTTAHIQKMRQEVIFTDGAIQSKHKALGAVLWSVSARCEPCIRYYVQQAALLGATEEEMGEFLALASTMGGCVGEMWALKAYKAFKDPSVSTETHAESDPSCCR